MYILFAGLPDVDKFTLYLLNISPQMPSSVSLAVGVTRLLIIQKERLKVISKRFIAPGEHDLLGYLSSTVSW